MTVDDLDRASRWFVDTLDFRVERVDERSGIAVDRLFGMADAAVRVATLRLGAESLELLDFERPGGRPVPTDSRSEDRWFQHVAIVVRDMDEAYAHVRSRGVAAISTGPQLLPDWNPAAAGIRAFYFRDPDGHVLELIEFPSGKGDPRWQSDAQRFLGIDHTAIVVDDTDCSLRVYRDLLGLRAVGRSENHGDEQERLNGVFACRVRITTLRAAAGPGIELLEYLTPRDGRPMPLDVRPDDLVHWQIEVTVPNVDTMFAAIRQTGGVPVSPGEQPVAWPTADTAPGALLARDPDGHGLLFLTRAATPAR